MHYNVRNAHLIRAPVPDGIDSERNEHAGPRELSVARGPEQVERVGARLAARAVPMHERDALVRWRAGVGPLLQQTRVPQKERCVRASVRVLLVEPTDAAHSDVGCGCE